MIKSLRTYFIVLLCYCSLNTGAQELKIPQPSTLQTIEQDFGLGQIAVTYSRPNAKGRKVFAGMEPYGVVWRTGANMCTKIKFTDSFLIEGHMVPPGEYGFFTIPRANEWTIIFNKNANQWGAYSYDSTQDVLRFNVKTARSDQKMETLTFQFANTFSEQSDLQILWENTVVSMHLVTDVDARVMANIDKAMSGDRKPYYFASIYYYNHNKDMNKALGWISDWDKQQPGAYNVKYWKARIQLKMGDKPGAIATANEGLKQATQEKDAEYIRLIKEVLAETSR
jgi:Protein of unknown function (DUF2911)